MADRETARIMSCPRFMEYETKGHCAIQDSRVMAVLDVPGPGG